MDSYTIEQLGKQIDTLLHEYNRKKEHNKSLQEKQARLMQERTILNLKLRKAVETIQSIIQQLKQLEKGEEDGPES